MKKVLQALHDFIAIFVRLILRGLIFIAFRPKRYFVSEKAKQELLRDPSVIISNHIAIYDGAVIQTLLPFKKIFGMTAKDVLEDEPMTRLLLSFCRVIPIDRRSISLAWLREGRKRLKEGNHVFMCPEGRCHEDKVIHPFKPGVVTLAASVGAKVIPIYQNGEYNFFFGKRFRMMIGEPVTLTPPPEGLAEDEMRREAELLRDVMTGLEMKLNGFVRTGGED